MKQAVRSVATLIAVASFVALAPSAAVLAATNQKIESASPAAFPITRKHYHFELQQNSLSK